VLTNYAQNIADVDSVVGFPDEAVVSAPDLNPPAGGAGQFIMACSAQVQTVYDSIWTALKIRRRSPVSCGAARAILSAAFIGQQTGTLCPSHTRRFAL